MVKIAGIFSLAWVDTSAGDPNSSVETVEGVSGGAGMVAEGLLQLLNTSIAPKMTTDTSHRLSISAYRQC